MSHINEEQNELPLFNLMQRDKNEKYGRPKTVSEISQTIKHSIETNPSLQNVSIIGEISNFKHHQGKHMYFSLKDEDAQIACVFFYHDNKKINFKPEDGKEVIASGSVSLYPPQGKYQFYVTDLIESGAGILWRKFEELKKKLSAEGLTSAERKRPLPAFPKKIGIVASTESAGLKDMLNVLSKRFPLAVVVIEQAAVEGESSASSIAAGLKRMSMREDVDVVIVGRGGGSIESLWGFNTEIVARAIVAMPVPVISAVGHETDFTIADLVADRRAATPTEAAVLAVPSIDDIKNTVSKSARKLNENILKIYKNAFNRTVMISKTLRSPDSTLRLKIERIDRMLELVNTSINELLQNASTRTISAENRISLFSPAQKLKEKILLLDSYKVRLRHSIKNQNERENKKFELITAKLKVVNPVSVLKRGYSVVMKDGRAVVNSSELSEKDRVSVRFSVGSALCDVIELNKEVQNGKE